MRLSSFCLDWCRFFFRRKFTRRKKFFMAVFLLIVSWYIYFGSSNTQIERITLLDHPKFTGRDVFDINTQRTMPLEEEQETTTDVAETTNVETTDVDLFSELQTTQNIHRVFAAENQKKIKSNNSCVSKTKLLGDLHMNKNISKNVEDLDAFALKGLQNGGCYVPPDCKPRQNLALIIPFKDRDAHLKHLLYYLHPMLMRQELRYCVYVAEQLDEGQFNKAMVNNAAFVEAMKRDTYDCIIFHDVDMLPENDKNLYVCGDDPVHLSPAIDKFNYKKSYGTKFGGVVGITPEQYRKANGHSNRFWGWGGEDNDMEFRIEHAGMNITQPDRAVARYQMIKHTASFKFSPVAGDEHKRLEKTQLERVDVDGLRSLQYMLDSEYKTPYYTKLMIDIQRLKIEEITVYINEKKVETFTDDKAPCYWQKFEGQNLLDKIENVTLKTLDEAIAACGKYQFQCNGVVRLSSLGKEVYELRRGVVPHQLVLTTRQVLITYNKETNAPERKFITKYIFPNRTSHLYTCPGHMGSLHSYQGVIATSENATNSFRFEIKMKTLHRFPNRMYYMDHMLLENKEEMPTKTLRKIDLQPSIWQKFKDKEGRPVTFISEKSSFSFETKPRMMPPIPGTYLVNSKLVDEFRQPYYQWNWWFHTSTGNDQLDCKLRSEFYRLQTEKRKEELKKLKLAEKRIKISSHSSKKKLEQDNAANAMKLQSNMEKQIRLLQEKEEKG